jgi:hypothetical protein
MAEGLVTNAVEAAEVARGVDWRVVGAFFTGLGLGVGAGATAGYLIGKRHHYIQAEKDLNEARDEYRKARDEYRRKMNIPVKPDIDQLVKDREERAKAKERERPTKPPVPVWEPNKVERDAIREANSKFPAEWDYEEELKRRGDEPFVIHVDEFKSNEHEYSQTTLTYYEKDDILFDDMQKDVINNMDDVVGLGNLLLFGHGSGDPNIVYVRNEGIDSDFEICLNPGSYAEEVHHLKHSDEPGKRRKAQRGFDDD